MPINSADDLAAQVENFNFGTTQFYRHSQYCDTIIEGAEPKRDAKGQIIEKRKKGIKERHPYWHCVMLVVCLDIHKKSKS